MFALACFRGVGEIKRRGRVCLQLTPLSEIIRVVIIMVLLFWGLQNSRFMNQICKHVKILRIFVAQVSPVSDTPFSGPFHCLNISPLIRNMDPRYRPPHVRHSEIHTWDTSLWKTLAIALRTYTASFPLTPPSPGHFSSYISFVPHSRLILLSLLFLVYDFYVF